MVNIFFKQKVLPVLEKIDGANNVAITKDRISELQSIIAAD